MSYAKKKDRKKGKTKIRIYGLACLAVLVFSILLYFYFQNPQSPFNLGGKRAAIIDGLSTMYENNTFWWTARDILKKAGYTTYYYQGGADTVSFYKNISTFNFGILIFRVHSAVNPANGQLAVFTNEKWSDSKASTTYLFDILNDRLARVRVEENSTSYFGITPNFVEAYGRFDNAIVIVMGCDSLRTNSMAYAFVQKGAKAYIGWDGPVTPQYIDRATINFLEHLLLEDKTISEAVEATIKEVGNDPDYGSSLRCYP